MSRVKEQFDGVAVPQLAVALLAAGDHPLRLRLAALDAEVQGLVIGQDAGDGLLSGLFPSAGEESQLDGPDLLPGGVVELAIDDRGGLGLRHPHNRRPELLIHLRQVPLSRLARGPTGRQENDGGNRQCGFVSHT